MKSKIFYGVFALALTFSISSCQQENLENEVIENENNKSLILKSTAESQYLFDLRNIVQSLIDEGKISAGVGNSIISKIANALKGYNKGNLNSANGLLSAIINEIEDLIDTGEVPASEGALLIKSVETVVKAVNGDPIITDGLVAYYPFNGNVLDESGNNNNGIATNLNFNNNRNDKPNSAAYFDGQAFAKIPPIGPTKSFSIAFWYKTPVGGMILNTDNIILSADDYIYQDIQYTFFRTSWKSIIGNSIGYYNPAGNPVYLNDTWHHVVVTHDAVNERIITFFDGVIRHNRPNSGYFAGNTTEITLGKTIFNALYAKDYTGSIDDIYIFNRGISIEEVTMIYTYSN